MLMQSVVHLVKIAAISGVDSELVDEYISPKSLPHLSYLAALSARPAYG